MESVMSRCVWLITILALLQGQAQSQLTPIAPGCSGISRGEHFIIGFTDNIEDKYTPSRELFILVVAFNNQQTTRVTISSKHQVGGQPFSETFDVDQSGFKQVRVPVELTMTDTERSFKTIDIFATNEVSAYGLMYQDFSTDAFLGIPTNNLGMQYVVVTPTVTRPGHFAIIGTDTDSTQVQVTMQGPATFEGRPYSRGDILSFTLSYQEAVQIRSEDDLTGSIIQADKPVAVFSGSECERNPGSACDTLTEQLVPVKSWGQKHIYTASLSTDSNQYYIVSYFPGTNVSIPGLEPLTFSAGDSWEGFLTGSGLVTSTKPILMMQQLATINGNTVDPSLIQVPAVEQFGSRFGFTTPPYSGGDRSEGYFNFITIVVKRDARQTVSLNNAPVSVTNGILPVDEHDVPGTDYISITIQVPKGEGVYYVDSQSSPVSVIVYGYERAETYGYAAGLSLDSNEQHLSFTPYFLRELGGERFSITVPCTQDSNEVNIVRKCKFSTGVGDVEVDGVRTGSYTLECITPTFYKNGLTAVYVSLDGGSTFPYSGVVYVPSEEDLPPLVTVQQMNQEAGSRVIDLNSADPIYISWDQTLVGDDVSHVTVMVRVSRYNTDGFPVLMEGVAVKSNVVNNGTLFIPGQDLKTFINPASNDPSLVAFYITQYNQRRRRDNVYARRIYSGVTHVINSILNVPCSVFNRQLNNVASGLNPCPCTSNQANVNSLNFVEANFLNSFFHPGAETCYRSTTSSSTGSGQQCCYDDNGDILVGSPGGGTADRYAPGDHFWFHQWYDVLPWLGCCKLSNNCEAYYDKRPSDDCSEYVPPRPAGGTGDPHITSLDGKRFTFNGAGEFLMASSTLHNLTFQARMEVYRDTNASVYTAVVIQTNDSAKVQVQRSNMNQTMILVDGETILQDSSPIPVQHHKGLRISFNRDLSEIKIALKSGVAVIVYVKPEVMSFIAQLDTKFKGQVKGLLGNMNEDPDDDLQFLNGSSLNTNAALYEVHELGLEWLVTEEDSIFTYISPYEYKTYLFPEFSPNLVSPDPNLISQEIKDLCGESFECIFDAMTTGSLSLANETLLVTGTLETIQMSSIKIVSCGFPGKVENGKIHGSVYLENSTLRVTCDGGFTQQGSASLWCQGDGQWSSNLPVCAQESKQINVVVVLLIALAGFTITVLMIWALFPIKEKNNPAKPN
ncbi:sushi domain-containing protein 2-like [Asterias rubens]|uniref:sushi domain-containing protein 2-like n=1 Tax=Asterias rubens TaxID=7604 RepID=UPI0014553ED2|nr:sushi domain-containing protein 2-like [Asterias rubens]XP_033629958.1 sushi domain-containing protein 2-like [Asterias rubens]